MAGTLKNKLHKIWEEMECDNKKIHARDSVDTAAFPIQAKNRVGSWEERVKETIKLASIDNKAVLSNSPDVDIYERI